MGVSHFNVLWDSLDLPNDKSVETVLALADEVTNTTLILSALSALKSVYYTSH
jgi:hypothetical protein